MIQFYLGQFGCDEPHLVENKPDTAEVNDSK